MAFGVKVNKKHTRLVVGTKSIKSGTAHTVRISPHMKAMRPGLGPERLAHITAHKVPQIHPGRAGRVSFRHSLMKGGSGIHEGAKILGKRKKI